MKDEARSQQEKALESLFPFRHRYMQLESWKIHYIDEGQGPVMVLFHACPFWSFSFREVIREFSRDHRVIALDLLGFGLSDKPAEFDYTINGYTALLEEFLWRLDLKKMIFILHGWGGTIGMSYAVRHPNFISSLIIMNSIAFSGHKLPWQLRICRLPAIGPRLIKTFLLYGSGHAALPPEIREAYLLPFQQEFSKGEDPLLPVQRFICSIPAVPEDEAAQSILAIESGLWSFRMKPVCIIWASHDFLYNRNALRRWHKCLPGAEIHTLERTTHYMLEEQPETFNAILRDFLKKNNLQNG